MNRGFKQRVLIVEDEAATRKLISINLQGAGFNVDTAADGAEALRKARSCRPDLITLEMILPGISGLQVCEQLRIHPETSQIPFIILSAKSSEVDRILGLECGALDYVTKPFSPRELILRIRRILSLVARENRTEAPHQFGELSIDISRHLVTVSGVAIDLTPTEFRLLTALAKRKGHVHSRATLLADIWENDGQTSARAVDTHIRRLRQKLGPAARFVKTVQGIGYQVAND